MRGESITGAILLAVAMPASAASSDDPICADRPGKGSSTCAAPKNHLQFEVGLGSWSVKDESDKKETEIKLGDVAIKYGLTESMHVEIAFPLLELKREKYDDGFSTRASSFGDTEVKVKQELTGEDEHFSAALYPYVKIPTANKKIGNGKVEGGLIVPLEYDIADTPWSLSASPEFSVNAQSDGSGYYPGMSQTVGLSFEAARSLSLSGELSGSWDWEPGDTSREYTFTASAAWTVDHDVQLDVGADFGLNSAAPDFELSGGVSVRF